MFTIGQLTQNCNIIILKIKFFFSKICNEEISRTEANHTDTLIEKGKPSVFALPITLILSCVLDIRKPHNSYFVISRNHVLQ